MTSFSDVRRFASLSLVAALTLMSCAHRPTPAPTAETSATDGAPQTSPQTSADAAPAVELLSPATVPAPSTDAVARIRDEGMNRSQVMQTLSYLTDVIGPRLTGSPNLRRANEWTRDKLTGWGLRNAHLEPWGPFGRGWSLERFSAQIVDPQAVPLIAYPKAWSPGFDEPVTAAVVYVNANSEADLAKYKGKLKGAIVLATPPRDVQARFEPLAVRVTDADLLKLANADAGSPSPLGLARAATASERRAQFGLGPIDRAATQPITTQPSTRPATTRGAAGAADNSPAAAARRTAFARRLFSFLVDEGAAVVVSPSTQGDGGTLFVAQATVPDATTRPATRAGAASRPATQPTSQPWAKDAPKTVPQITMAIEHYNRLVRMIEQGEALKMRVDLKVRFHDADLMAYNTVAEIPGTDLKDQIVMLGAHMDSWHSGTGATDNGAGTAAMMEAVRILQAAKLKPRRTIRIALWTGEEQGLYGSKAYVAEHFGKMEDLAATRPTTGATTTTTITPTTGLSPSSGAPGEGRGEGPPRPTTRDARSTARPARKLVRGPEYDALSAYFNLDNGTGKIRGVYLQGNEAVRPYFRRWLAPFVEDGAQTLTPVNTGGTDHLSFDAIGLPGFQFIQDPVEYWSRTHHSNQDTFERIQADDLKQAATIIATFVYNAATLDDKLPRKRLMGVD
jgi:hypothetical protein